jgi:hypothetical protein
MSVLVAAKETTTSQNAERPRRRLSRAAFWIRGEIRDEAADRWRVRPRTAELLFLAPAVGAVLTAVAAFDRELFTILVDEDSVLEWAQVPAFLAGFVGGTVLALRAHRQGRLRPALGYAVFAAACFFVTGEELSWGQRLLDFGTPEAIRERNNQDEVTLHNIVEVRVLFKFFLIALGIAGAVLPWVLRLRGSRWATLMPPLFTTTTFLLLFGYNAARLVFFPQGFFGWEENFRVGKYGEWPETCLAYLTAGFAWLAWRSGR